jgi:hypothetical protein
VKHNQFLKKKKKKILIFHEYLNLSNLDFVIIDY